MIKTFSDKTTAAVFAGFAAKKLPPIIMKRAREKLDMLHRARVLDDLRAPPANRLEALSGDRAGFWSIRINNQWRVCFRFENGDAFDVEIVDYH
jgi:proteic killer suppression protein